MVQLGVVNDAVRMDQENNEVTGQVCLNDNDQVASSAISVNVSPEEKLEVRSSGRIRKLTKRYDGR